MITKIFKSKTIASLGIAFLLTSCGVDESDDDNRAPLPETSADANAQSELTIAGIVSESETFQTLLAAVDTANLVDTLSGEGPFTVFAPTDEAFAKLPEGTVESLLLEENRDKLTNILLYHVVPGQFFAEDVLASAELSSAFGQSLRVDADAVQISGANIIDTDIAASNGVIHVIDTVMIPLDITQLAANAGFSTLVAALTAADLVATLQGDGPFTVFAPTDEAFANLPEGTLEFLLQPENKQTLIDILSYHVVPGNLKADEVLAFDALGSVEGSDISVTVDGGAKVDDANITATDIVALNGTIHVIDAVILPPGI